MPRKRTPQPPSYQERDFLLFALDEDAATEIEKLFQQVLDGAEVDVQITKEFVPAYAGDWAGYCFSVAAGVASNAVYDLCLGLLRAARRAKRGVPWISFQLAEAVVREDLAKRLNAGAFELVQAVDLERESCRAPSLTAPFHQPDKGYIFLVRGPDGERHYYEISTDGRIMCYQRYARNQKSLLELARRR